MTNSNRRTFMKQAATAGAALASAGLAPSLFAQAKTGKWAAQVGIELYTIRDFMDKDYEGGLAKVAEIGYKEVEPANAYNGLSPAAFRKLLDKYGLTAPSTHSAPVIGPDLEKQFEGFQIMGIQYTSLPVKAVPTYPSTAPRSGGMLGAYFGGRNSFTQAEAFGPIQKPLKLQDAKERAAELNKYGKIGSKFKVKMLIHNHTGEFEKLLDSDRTEYDVYLSDCDPELVTMQLDLGWATISGQDILGMFRKNPGRYELWHIKDMFGIQRFDKSVNLHDRANNVTFEPYGVGQIDYKPFFDAAELAGLKHFCVEQDNAATWGDSIAAARISYQNLNTMLTTGSLPNALYH